MSVDTETGVLGGKVHADPNSNPKISTGEFPTAWHRATYITNLEREIQGAIVRGEKDVEAAARRELDRLVKKPAAKKAAES